MAELQDKIKRIRQLDKDLIPEAIEDMQRFLSIATACTAQSGGSEIQRTVSENSKEKAMILYADASIKVNDLQDELADLKLEVTKEVDKIKGDKQRRFAKLYYIDQKSQKDIAQQSHYAYSTVRNNLININKVHSSTLNAIELPQHDMI